MFEKNYDDVLSKLKDVKSTSDHQASACCPAHDDHKSSLSVSDKGDQIFLYCHAGCSYESIVAALGLDSDWLQAPENDKVALEKLVESTETYSLEAANGRLNYSSSKLKCLTLKELLNLEVPESRYLLEPIIKTQSLVMLYAYRGVGKTWAALEIAVAVASGGSWLKWSSPQPSGVLYIDGEMPAGVLRERVEMIVANRTPTPIASLFFLTPDVQEFGIPNLSTVDGQRQVGEFITDEIRLIVLDNLSTLARSGKENEGESWLPLQQWALGLRSKGKSVLFIHHAGKSGEQRGSSRREDVLDTVIKLTRPSDYTPEDGAVFEIHFDKARGILGTDTMPIVARLGSGTNHMDWTWELLEDTTYEKVVRMLNEGMEVKHIAEDLGITLQAVYKHRTRAKKEGNFNKSTCLVK